MITDFIMKSYYILANKDTWIENQLIDKWYQRLLILSYIYELNETCNTIEHFKLLLSIKLLITLIYYFILNFERDRSYLLGLNAELIYFSLYLFT